LLCSRIDQEDVYWAIVAINTSLGDKLYNLIYLYVKLQIYA